jgi:type 1 fimbria pilin
MKLNSFALNVARVLVFVVTGYPLYGVAGCYTGHTQIAQIQLPNITLSGTEHNGTILAQDSVPITENTKDSSLECDSSGHLLAFATNRLLTGGHIFATSIPGIGYRLFLNHQAFPLKIAVQCNSTSCHPGGLENSMIELQLVQTTEHVTSGGHLRGGTYGVVRPDSGKPALLINLRHPVTIQRAACNPTSSTVDLGVASLTDFPSQFSASQKIPFLVQMNCPASVRVRARWEGYTDKYGLLRTFQGKSRAEGISVRIRDIAGTSLPLDNTFQIVQPDYGQFSAEMVRTGEIKPGKIDAIATLHLIYE